MNKLIVAFLSFAIFSFLLIQPTFAAPKVKYSPQAVSILNHNQTNLKTTFINIKKATEISYTLTYEAQGVPQGVGGVIVPGGKNVVFKNITIGTCSSGTCVNHKKIKKMKLEVVYTFPGKTITKTYKINAK
ncbi:MAG: hypothetical protein KA035_02230 [Candidatus Levybacteria bacterium]|nr:hypothetical protein [Candidatus Levybacteria bacterium]